MKEVDLLKIRQLRRNRSESAIKRLADAAGRISAGDPAFTRQNCYAALTSGFLWDVCAEAVETDQDLLRSWSAAPETDCWPVGFIEDMVDDDTPDDDLSPAATRAADLVRLADTMAKDGAVATVIGHADGEVSVNGTPELMALSRTVDNWRTAHLLPRGQATERLLPARALPRVRQVADLVAPLPGGSARTMVCLQAQLLAGSRRRRRRHKAVRVLFEQRREGLSGTLEMEILPDGPYGLFPDPRTMGMVTADAAFEDAITDAWMHVTGQRETRACVLWRLTIDGPWSLRIQGGSLGAAFAVLLSEVIGPPGGRFLTSGPLGTVRAAGRWLRVRRDRMAITGRARVDGDLGSVGGLKAKLERAKALKLSVVAPAANKRADEQYADGVAVRWVPNVRIARRELYRIDRLRSSILATGMVAVLAASGFGLYVTQIRDKQRAQAVGASRQIIAEANGIADTQPGLARQLLVAAYGIQPTDEALGALLNGSSIPGSLHIPGLRTITYAPNRAILAVATDSGIRLLNTATGAVIATMAGNNGYVGALSFSPDGHTLAAGEQQGVVRLWEVSDPAHPKVLNELQPDSDQDIVAELAFTPDGHTLIVSSEAQQVRLWNVTNPLSASQLATIPGFELATDAPLALSRDGNTIAISGENSTVILWDISDRAVPRRLSVLSGHTSGVSSVRFSPDGHLLASGGGDFTVRLWDVTSLTHPKPLSTLSGHTFTVGALAFSPDGHALASAASDDDVRLWNVSDPLRPSVITTLAGSAGTIPALDFSPDGRTLASTTDGDVLRLWDIAKPGTSVPLTTMNDGDAPIAFRRDGKLLLTTGGDYTGRLWDVHDPAVPKALGVLTGHTYLIDRVAYSPDGHTVATSSLDGTTRLWDVGDPKNPRSIATFGSRTQSVGDPAFSPDGHLLVTSGDSGLRLWDVTEPAHPKGRGTLTEPGAAEFLPAGHLLLSRGDDKHPIRLWDISDPNRPRLRSTLRVNDSNTIALTPNGKTLLTSGSADTARLWNLDDPEHPRARAVLTGTGTVNAAAFSPDGRLLATAGSQPQVRVWNVSDSAHPTSVTTFTGRPALVTPEEALAFGPDGRSLATGGDRVALWDINPTDLLRRLCTQSGDPITTTQWRQYVPRYTYRKPCRDLSGDSPGAVPPETVFSPIPTGRPSSPAPPTQSPAAGTTPLNIRKYDWANAEIPVPFCSISGTVKFKKKEATAPSTKWGRVHVAQVGDVAYGDLLGTGHPVAALPLMCDNGGGTADAEIAGADVIFDGSHGQLVALGAITPQQPSSEVTTNISKVTITRRRITAYEIWYRLPDASCCASGRAVTTWTYKNGRFIPGTPHITS
jgi:WD40 repeat protein